MSDLAAADETGDFRGRYSSVAQMLFRGSFRAFAPGSELAEDHEEMRSLSKAAGKLVLADREAVSLGGAVVGDAFSRVYESFPKLSWRKDTILNSAARGGTLHDGKSPRTG